MVLRAGSFGAPFSNSSDVFETTYDFSADTGAQATYVMSAGASEACMIKLIAVKVETACTSGGNATVSIETSTSANAFITTEAYGSFTEGAVVTPESASTGTEGFVKIAADDTLDLTIATADLTAGKLICVWEVRKF